MQVTRAIQAGYVRAQLARTTRSNLFRINLNIEPKRHAVLGRRRADGRAPFDGPRHGRADYGAVARSIGLPSNAALTCGMIRMSFLATCARRLSSVLRAQLS